MLSWLLAIWYQSQFHSLWRRWVVPSHIIFSIPLNVHRFLADIAKQRVKIEYTFSWYEFVEDAWQTLASDGSKMGAQLSNVPFCRRRAHADENGVSRHFANGVVQGASNAPRASLPTGSYFHNGEKVTDAAGGINVQQTKKMKS